MLHGAGRVTAGTWDFVELFRANGTGLVRPSVYSLGKVCNAGRAALGEWDSRSSGGGSGGLALGSPGLCRASELPARPELN